MTRDRKQQRAKYMYRAKLDNFYYLVYWNSDKNKSKEPVNVFNSLEEAKEYVATKEIQDDYQIRHGKHKELVIEATKLQKPKAKRKYKQSLRPPKHT